MSAGGRAAAGGTRYQSRVAAWLAARMLDGPQAVALWGLPVGTTLLEIWCEAPFNPSDVVLRTSDGGLVFCQAKSGRVALSSHDRAPLRRAFSQFVSRYRNVTATGDNPEWRRPLDHQRDRQVLLVERQAGGPLVRDGRNVLERLRAAPGDREPQRTELSESRSEPDVLGRLLQLLWSEWESQAGHRPADGDVWSLLRLVHIQPADVGDGDPEGREARDTLARLTRACGSPESPRSELLQIMGSAQARGGPMCSQSIAEALARRGVPVRPLPRVAPDVEALKSRTLRALESLLSGATLPGPDGPVVIDRPVVDALDAAWAGGPVVVVGEAGAGKTAVLVRLAQRLLGSGHDVVLLRAEELTSAGPGALRQELGLTLDLQEVLRGWVGSTSAVIVVDALDAARDRSTLMLLNELMRDLSALPRWRVVASVREYDLEHGPEIKALFRGRPPSPGHADARFQDLRHIAVARLSDAELEQASSRLPHLARVLGPGHTSIRDLLRSPFNLRLAAELLADGVAVTNLECARTRMDLLDQFWSHRVPPGDRERALDELVDTMVDRLSLQLDEAWFRSTIASAEAQEGLLRDAVLVRRATPYGHDVAFAHNILFDHAVARLKLRRRPEDLACYLRQRNERVLAVLPSIRMHFEFVWSRQNDREPLWDLVLCLGSDDTVPTIVRRLGVAAAVDLARDRSGLDPLRRTQTRGGSGPSGAPRWLISELAGALCLDESVDRVRRHGDLWAHVAERLSLCIGADWDPVAHTVFLLIRHLAPGVELTPSQRSNVGAAARLLVRQAWTRHWAPEVSRVALAGVYQTYRSDPAAPATIIRECFAPHHLATRDCQDVPVLAREIGWLMEAAPELVAKIYERTFAHAPAAPDERTVFGASQILRLTSDRRQDYEAALRSLGAALPRFLDEAPQAAARADRVSNK